MMIDDGDTWTPSQNELVMKLADLADRATVDRESLDRAEAQRQERCPHSDTIPFSCACCIGSRHCVACLARVGP